MPITDVPPPGVWASSPDLEVIPVDTIVAAGAPLTADMAVASLPPPLALLPLGVAVATGVSGAAALATATAEPLAPLLPPLVVSSSSPVVVLSVLAAPRRDLENLPPFILEGSEGEEMEAEEWHLIKVASDRADKSLGTMECILLNFREVASIARSSMTGDIIPHGSVGAFFIRFSLLENSSSRLSWSFFRSSQRLFSPPMDGGGAAGRAVGGREADCFVTLLH